MILIIIIILMILIIFIYLMLFLRFPNSCSDLGDRSGSSLTFWRPMDGHFVDNFIFHNFPNFLRKSQPVVGVGVSFLFINFVSAGGGGGSRGRSATEFFSCKLGGQSGTGAGAGARARAPAHAQEQPNKNGHETAKYRPAAAQNEG